MSQSFRAVKEIWNAHSSCFIEPEKLIVLLHDLAARVGTASDEHEYGDKQAVWLENGRKVLDYMEADERFSAASFKDSMEEQGIAVNQEWIDDSDRQYAELVETVAKFHRKTRGIVVLHRCMLNPADGTFHSLVLSLLGAPLPHLGALSHNRDAKSYQHEPCRDCTQTHGRTRGIKSCHQDPEGSV